MGLTSELTREQALMLYDQILSDNDTDSIKRLLKEDLFFLLMIGCRRPDVNHDFLYQCCREVEAEPNGMLDLWARDHYKSTIITFAKTIQDVLNNPNVTICIFSHTRPIAKAFLEQIKRELENNDFLKSMFPDILYDKPERESDSWSIDGGIVVKRTNNPKEKTIEAWGLVDSQPVGKHFQIQVYDDTVSLDSVSSPEMMTKTTSAFLLSLSILDSRVGIIRMIGTRYHFNDTYKRIIEDGIAIPRIKPATIDGTPYGDPVFLSHSKLQEKKKHGPYIFSCQYLLNPKAEGSEGFKTEWLRYYDIQPDRMHMNVVILVDPASAKKKHSDFTVMLVVGMARDGNYYILDGKRDRMNLPERTRALFSFVHKWKPIKVIYEQYGMQSDIEHIRYVQQHESYRFEIQPIGGIMSKQDRIKRLIPDFEAGRIYWPRRMVQTQADGNVVDLVQLFESEFREFPVSQHDDIMDDLSRLKDEIGLRAPIMAGVGNMGLASKTNNRYDPFAALASRASSRYRR
jgi:predicted phage terminase large subunit-like protein